MPRRPAQSDRSPAPPARARAPISGEAEAIDLIRRVLRTRAAREAEDWVGIGDDAAVLRPRPGPLVWTVDAQVEGVHFDLDWLSLDDVGWRSFQAAASDLAAMGAKPIAALSSLVLPRGFTGLAELVRGQSQASRALACPLVGGNIARGAELSITTTCVGSTTRPLLRSAARPGHELWLIGPVGLARAGLRALQLALSSDSSALDACRAAWRRPVAHLREGMALARAAHAALDVSDGLSRDAGHLATASRVRVVVEEALLRSCLGEELLEAAHELGEDALALALEGGEDYALLAAGSGRRPRCARRIGRIERGRGAWLEDSSGRRLALTGGYDHLR